MAIKLAAPRRGAGGAPQKEGPGARAATSAGSDERRPLVVQQFVGAGRCLFLGFDETWAWSFREDHACSFNQFWIQIVHYLARNRLGRVDLRLDRADALSPRRADPRHGSLPR